jgi:hypothetical protein
MEPVGIIEPHSSSRKALGKNDVLVADKPHSALLALPDEIGASWFRGRRIVTKRWNRDGQSRLFCGGFSPSHTRTHNSPKRQSISCSVIALCLSSKYSGRTPVSMKSRVDLHLWAEVCLRVYSIPGNLHQRPNFRCSFQPSLALVKALQQPRKDTRLLWQDPSRKVPGVRNLTRATHASNV